MKYTSLSASRLTPELLDQWNDLLADAPELAGPHLRPEYVLAVAQHLPRIEVAVLEDAGRVVGFFPFERTLWNVALPVGRGLSDYQAVIAAPEAPWRPERLMGALKLSAWRFHHQLASQAQLAPHFVSLTKSPVIDLSLGYEAWLEGRCAVQPKLKGVRRKMRKLERESQSLQLEWRTTDADVFETLRAWKSAQYVRTGAHDAFRLNWLVGLLEQLSRTDTPHFRGVMSTLRADGRLLAVHLGLQAGSTLHWWFPTYNRERACASPGMQHLIRIAAAAAENGVTRIDLGKGYAEYKSILANDEVAIAEGSVDRRPFAKTIQNGLGVARARARSLRERASSRRLRPAPIQHLDESDRQ